MMTTSTPTLNLNDEDVRVPARRPDPTARNRRLRVSMAGLAIAGALAGLSVVMMGNANYSDRYVTAQLVQQRITFKAADLLTDAERQSRCVVANAGKPLTTGKQAECYANGFIGTHVKAIGGGKTYAELEDVRAALTARIAAAQASGDPELANLQKDMAALTAQRDTLFKAETLRGILLTSFGFSTLGQKAGQAAQVAEAAAGLSAMLSVAGLMWAWRTPGARSPRPSRR